MTIKNNKRFTTIAIAGTFDRLHKGHRYFIKQAFRRGHKVIIGLTSDKFAKSKFSIFNFQFSNKIQIQNFQTRRKELEEYLKQNGLLERAEIVKIDDVYGPAVGNTGIEALAVTEETHVGGLLVNKKRVELELPELRLLKIPIILADDEKKIASTRIRLGEIDRWGRLYQSRIQNSELRITDESRNKLKKPLGLLIKGNPNDLKEVEGELKKMMGAINPVLISTVGDEVTKVCNEAGLAINLAIVDFRVHREEKYHSLEELGLKPILARAALANGVGTVKNPQGHITKELVDAVKNAYLGIIKDGNRRIIQVAGEEDLAGVPAILLAPLGSVVLYGQPHEGIVVVEVTEERKNELLSLIDKNF